MIHRVEAPSEQMSAQAGHCKNVPYDGLHQAILQALNCSEAVREGEHTFSRTARVFLPGSESQAVECPAQEMF